MRLLKKHKSQAIGPGPGRAAPDAILPHDREWLVAGLDDQDLSAEATERRFELMAHLVGDQSFAAARRVLEKIMAAPVKGEKVAWLRLFGEFTYLRALPKPDDREASRRDEVGREIVRRFAEHPDAGLRAEALLVEATLQITDGQTAERWLRRVRLRRDFEALRQSEQFREGVEMLEKMVREDSDGGPVGAPNEDFARITQLLRWWSEPGAALPARLGTVALPPPGAVVMAVNNDSEAMEALVIAAHLAQQGRYGDAHACIRSVADFAEDHGHDLARALATVIEGELLVLVDRVPEAVESLWTGAGDLYRLGRLDTSVQVFLDLAGLGASHPQVDELLIGRVEVPDPGRRGARLLGVLYTAHSLAEAIGDEHGKWLADLIRAQALFALGCHALSREAILGLPAPPESPSRDLAQVQALLARARILLTTLGPDASLKALVEAEKLPTAHHPWFQWQVHAIRAELQHHKGDLDGAWTSSERALGVLRSARLVVGDEHDRSAWCSSRQSVWREALLIARERTRPADALLVIEDAKSTQQARTIRAQTLAGSDPEAAGLLREAMRRLAASSPPAGPLDHAALMAAHRQSHDVVQRSRRGDAQLSDAIEPPRLDRDSLPRLRERFGHFLLIDFLDLGGESIWRVAASSEGALDVRELALDSGHRDSLARLDAATGAARVEEWIRRGEDAGAIHDLGRALLDGIAPPVGCDTLLISPSGRLGNVPWAMLELAGGIVIDHLAVALLPSLVLGETLAERTRSDGAPLMFCCDPAGDLKGIARQRDRLREIWPDLKVVEGEHARTSTLVAMSESGELREASRLIWAGHGEAHPDEPLASGLQLADGSAITAGAIAALDLPTSIELWTCSSAAERRLPFDEQLGIVAACIRAGASSVLASLWPLDDEQVGELSGCYHERLSRGDPPHEAWRQVQLAHRGHVSPSVWAAVTLWGVAPQRDAQRARSPEDRAEPPPEAPKATPHASVTVVSSPLWAPPVAPLAPAGGGVDAVLQRAQAISDRCGWGYVGTGDFVWSLLHEEIVGPALCDAGILPVRVEGLLIQLPSLERTPELQGARSGGRSVLLQAVLDELRDELRSRPASDPRRMLAAVFSRAGSQARRIVEHCGVDPVDIEHWISGDAFPNVQRWRPYDPSTASLVDVGAEERYEKLCATLPADLWDPEPWPARWLALCGARLRDLPREKPGWSARSRLKTLADHDALRARGAAGSTAHRLAQLAMVHAGGDRRDRIAGSWTSPQEALAVSAARTALALAQVHGFVGLQAQCHFLLGDLLRDRSHPNAAIVHARLAGELARFIGDHRIEAYAQITLAHARAGDAPRWNPDLRSSIDIYSQHYERAAEIFRQAGEAEDAHAILATLQEIRR